MINKKSIQIIENTRIFSKSNPNQILNEVLKEKETDEAILIVPAEFFSLFTEIENNHIIWDLYLNGIYLLSANLYNQYKALLKENELLENLLEIKVKAFYKSLIRTLVDQYTEKLLTGEIEVTPAIPAIRSNLINLLSNSKLTVKPGWLNLLNHNGALYVISLVKVLLKNHTIFLIVKMGPFHKKPSPSELKELFEHFLFEFIKLIAQRRSVPSIKLKTSFGEFIIEDLTKYLGKRFVILTDTGLKISNIKQLIQNEPQNIKFLFLKGGIL